MTVRLEIALKIYEELMIVHGSSREAFKNLHKEVLQLPIIELELEVKVKKIIPEKPKDKITPKKKRKKYTAECWRLTNLVAKDIPRIALRGFKEYHIDHIVPISYGYKHGIPCEKIASLENLVMLYHRENLDKGRKLTSDGIALVEKWNF